MASSRSRSVASQNPKTSSGVIQPGLAGLSSMDFTVYRSLLLRVRPSIAGGGPCMGHAARAQAKRRCAISAVVHGRGNRTSHQRGGNLRAAICC